MTKTTIFRSSRVAIAMVGAVVAPTFAFSQAAPRPPARRPIAPASASTSGPTVFTRPLDDRATADTAQAQALYVSRQFAVAGRRAKYYRKPVEDALVLRREL